MNILYDGQIYTYQTAGGINRYFANIISGLPEQFKPTLIAQESRDINYPLHPNLKVFKWHKQFRPERLRILVDRLYSKVILKFNRFDLAHPTYYSLVTQQEIENYPCPVVITVCDMIHELFSQTTPFSHHLIPIKKKAIFSAKNILCISENTKKDLMEIYAVPENKISVIYLASEVNISMSYGNELIPNSPYFFYVGSRTKYKNFDRLLLAFAKIVSDYPDLKLCVVGPAFNKAEQKTIAELNLENYLENYGYVRDTHLAKLYHHSMALVYPSLYEGFGIPPLEAMSCGTVVIAANCSSIPEVVGDAGLLFNPESTDELADRLLYLFNHPLERDRLINQGLKRSQLFSWEKTVAQTIQVYQSLT